MATGNEGYVESVEKTINQTVESVGHNITDSVQQAGDWVKDKVQSIGQQNEEASSTCKTTADIREHMDVIGSCGGLLGKVDRVEGKSIKLTKDSPQANGQHRYIPLTWVARVDQHVHLNKRCPDAEQEWQAHPVQEGEYPPATK